VTNNVLLGPLQDNGGPTLTHALLPGSPAIDAGDNTDAPLMDQRGVPRPQGAAVDIGAFELAQASPPLFTVCQTNLTVPVDPGLCTALVSFNVTADGIPAPEVVCRTDLATITSPARFTTGTHTVTCTASNVAGSATCEFTVTVQGTTAPSITCPSNIVQSVEPGRMTANVSWPPPVFDTGCGSGVSGCQPPSGSEFAVGTNSVVCFVANADGDRATCSFTVTVTASVTVQGPRDLKQSVLTNLIALRVDKRMKPDKDKLDDAIKHLSKSLDPNLWVDSAHLQPKDGEKVFQEEKETAHKLEELIKNKKSSIPDATLEALVADLVKADRQLAEVAIHEAKAAGFDSKAIQHALDEFSKATREASQGKSESAIEHYRNAWKEVVPKAPQGPKGPKGPMAPMEPK
jgi:HYR domain